MISLLNLLILSLRLTLAVQGQAVGILLNDFFGDRIAASDLGSDQELHEFLIPAFANEYGFIEAEEEKTEDKSESVADILALLFQDSIEREPRLLSNTIFGNKPIQGDLHLYDIFQSWKTHLG
ncbi:hypothetical protein SAMN03080617_00755 [Algoriphagus alkaliphilus]|uniref:Uncharacterized protein n=1 Tax=Algoriphagus alkaliphilus TaxID=279824 RepID=A0A1G5VY97_9BACT|nr:hypothetical protein [Algoriphagus alkaliphilus]SDA50812.1 hypothetical protein SAMN03080617_00755 [Algoriphagus alkaliphilus]